MELDCVLLGLIRLHQDVSGYELNRILRESTGYLMSASLSHIYPALRKLHEQGLVAYIDQPIKNRPARKIYHITPEGEQALQEWLRTPIEESDIDFRPFMLRMAFSPLMSKETILEHIEREIARRERMLAVNDRGNRLEMDYLDRSSIDPDRAEVLWRGIYQVGIQTSQLRLAWLKQWRGEIESGLAR
jgi:DNA-binding PadR family transcriptional regulator